MRGRECTPGRQQGLSLFEIAVITVVVGLLMVIAMDRMLRLTVDIERVNVQRVTGQLQSALSMEFAQRVVDGRRDSLARLNGMNPMTLALKPPRDYEGELTSAQAQNVEPGHWYFNRETGTLVYRVRYQRHFQSPTPDVARYRTELVFRDVDGDGAFHAPPDRPEGVRLTALGDYRWN